MAASRKSKRFWIWLGAGVLLAVVLLAIGVARLAKGAAIDPNRLARVTRGDVARSVVATGQIQPITKVEVKSKASGIVEKLFADINNRVSKGQPLAQLDQQEILAQVQAQRAQLAAAQANVSTCQANIEQDKVNAAAPDLLMYRATLDRNLEMQKLGVVSRQALDDARKDYLAALTRRDSYQAQIGVDAAKLRQPAEELFKAVWRRETGTPCRAAVAERIVDGAVEGGKLSFRRIMQATQQALLTEPRVAATGV